MGFLDIFSSDLLGNVSLNELLNLDIVKLLVYLNHHLKPVIFLVLDYGFKEFTFNF